jgi:hypothetical protein
MGVRELGGNAEFGGGRNLGHKGCYLLVRPNIDLTIQIVPSFCGREALSTTEHNVKCSS